MGSLSTLKATRLEINQTQRGTAESHLWNQPWIWLLPTLACLLGQTASHFLSFYISPHTAPLTAPMAVVLDTPSLQHTTMKSKAARRDTAQDSSKVQFARSSGNKLLMTVGSW